MNTQESLDGEKVIILCANDEIGRIPLYNLEVIITFGYTGASPALMGACAKRNTSLCFMSAQYLSASWILQNADR